MLMGRKETKRCSNCSCDLYRVRVFGGHLQVVADAIMCNTDRFFMYVVM